MSSAKRHSDTIYAMLGGIVTSYLVCPIMLNAWVSLGWRRPIQNWMIAHGVGSFAGYFGVFYISIPDYTTAIIGGSVIGVVAWKRWWQLSLLYSGTMYVLPYLYMMLFGSISIIPNHNAWVFVKVLLLDFAIIPLALAGAFVTSKRQRMHHFRREHQLCSKCGYDLTGNVSGVCPECGTPVTRCPEGAKDSSPG